MLCCSLLALLLGPLATLPHAPKVRLAIGLLVLAGIGSLTLAVALPSSRLAWPLCTMNAVRRPPVP
jgi:hypothetical protein